MQPTDDYRIVVSPDSGVPKAGLRERWLTYVRQHARASVLVLIVLVFFGASSAALLSNHHSPGKQGTVLLTGASESPAPADNNGDKIGSSSSSSKITSSGKTSGKTSSGGTTTSISSSDDSKSSGGGTDPSGGSSSGGDISQSLQLGVYSSGNGWSTTVGLFPNVNTTSFYYVYNGWGSVSSAIKTAAQHTAALDVSILTKNGSAPITWDSITDGSHDSRLISYIQGLDELPTITRLSLDQEVDQKVLKQNGSVAPDQTPAQFAAAADHVAGLVRKYATRGHVKNEFWISGTAGQSTSLPYFPTASKFDYVSWDPYLTGSHSKSQTADSLFAGFLPTITAAGWQNVSRVITETGFALDRKDSFTADDVIAFYNSIPAGAAANDIKSVTWFRTNSGNHPYIPTAYPGVDSAWNTLINKYDK